MKKLSIMIIDDNQDDRYLLKRQLKPLDIANRIFEADNGQEALDFLSSYEVNKKTYPNEFPPNLIFLDINMPIIDGFDFMNKFNELRKLEDFKSSILVMFTTSDALNEQQKALKYDFVRGYVVKMPSSSEDLKNILAKALLICSN